MWRIAASLALLIALAGAAWWVLHRAGPEGQLRIDWLPAAPLAPGVSIREGKLPSAPVWRLIDLSVDPRSARLKVVARAGGGRLEQLVAPGAVAAVNGGYFDERYRPTGWLVDQGHELAPRQTRAQGGVLALAQGRLFIGPMATLPFEPELALQNGPRLVEPGGQVGIRSEDGRRASRTLACDVAGRLHLVVISAPLSEGPTLLEAARLLATDPVLGGLGCEAALNLDGGPSTGIWLPPAAGVAPAPAAAPIAYALSVLPR